MDKNLLPFNLSEPIEALVTSLESQIGSEIILKEMHFPPHDADASARGGFDNWTPFVGINVEKRDEVDEHAVAHELLHIKRFSEGAYILETPDRLQGRTDVDAQNRMRFVDDVTNQIEHIAIFPQLVSYCFDPHKQADEWKVRQIERLSSPPPKWGAVDHSWVCIKVGVAEHIGSDRNLNEKYKACFRKIDPDAVKKGEDVAKSIRRWGMEKQYNMRRLYREMLRIADVPKNSLFLKQQDFHFKRERLEQI